MTAHLVRAWRSWSRLEASITWADMGLAAAWGLLAAVAVLVGAFTAVPS